VSKVASLLSTVLALCGVLITFAGFTIELLEHATRSQEHPRPLPAWAWMVPGVPEANIWPAGLASQFLAMGYRATLPGACTDARCRLGPAGILPRASRAAPL